MKTELFDMVDMDYLFTVITADRAVEYTGKEVYVAGSIKDLEFQIKEGTTRTLEGINSILCELRLMYIMTTAQPAPMHCVCLLIR